VSGKCYNSAYIIDRQGNLLANYRKTHLFETDKTWAQEGQGFGSYELQNVDGQKFVACIGNLIFI
jgi:protein N-terminal amidase